MRTDPCFQKWGGWLKIIKDDVQTLYLSRSIFTGVIDIVKKNQKIDKRSMFFGFFTSIYIDSMVMGIRRQLKIQCDSISLAKLLTEIAEKPTLITRADYYELFDNFTSPAKAAIMEDGFNRFAEPTSLKIDDDRVRKDLLSLKPICKAAEEYADHCVAHWDKKAPSLDLTIEDTFKSLDNLGDLVQRYYGLFFASNLKLEPIPQSPIFDIFQEPWLVPLSSPDSETG